MRRYVLPIALVAFVALVQQCHASIQILSQSVFTRTYYEAGTDIEEHTPAQGISRHYGGGSGSDFAGVYVSTQIGFLEIVIDLGIYVTPWDPYYPGNPDGIVAEAEAAVDITFEVGGCGVEAFWLPGAGGGYPEVQGQFPQLVALTGEVIGDPNDHWVILTPGTYSISANLIRRLDGYPGDPVDLPFVTFGFSSFSELDCVPEASAFCVWSMLAALGMIGGRRR